LIRAADDFYFVAHEIKNPLTPIQLSAERLRQKFKKKLDGSDFELLDRLTHTIENQVDSLKSMVNAFADYASTPNLTLSNTCINTLMQDVAVLYRDPDENISVELTLDPNVPEIPVDVPRMRQLLHNLIKNSLEAQHGQLEEVVHIKTELRHNALHPVLDIRAEDHGPGFPVDLLDRLFEPYVTSKPKGTGLGLAIVKKIVEEHNGKIRAENSPNGGATVIISLPYPSPLQLRGDAA